VLCALVSREAAIMSFNDTFWATFALILCSLPLVFLLGKAREGVEIEMGH